MNFSLRSIVCACASLALLSCVGFPASAVTSQARPAAAAANYADEAVDLLSRYLQVDTTNPPGNEKLGAQFLADIFEKNGIKAEVFETAPGRACVYARLNGNGKKRPIVLLNHIDVVPARPEDWKHHPFKGEVIDGEIWGRGALDMKGFGIAELETMLMLKRSGKTLDRDIIFLGTPDEEVGGTHGAAWFAKNKPELVKGAEFLINEGAAIDTSPDGKPKYWGVDISEKSVLWLKLTAKGDAGHASMPMPESAPNKLIRAVSKVVNSPPSPMVLPAVEQFFSDIAKTEPEPMRSLFANVKASVQDPKSYAEILKNRQLSPMLRNTVSLTVLKAGYKTNVIPAEASAELDCRLLPGADKDKFIAEIKEKMADPAIEVSVLDWVHADASPYDTELFSVIKKVAAKNQPGVPVVPVVVPWFTDAHWFRDLGIMSYGFMPFEIDPEHIATMHGKDERMPVKSFTQGVQFLHEIVGDLCGE